MITSNVRGGSPLLQVRSLLALHHIVIGMRSRVNLEGRRQFQDVYYHLVSWFWFQTAPKLFLFVVEVWDKGALFQFPISLKIAMGVVLNKLYQFSQQHSIRDELNSLHVWLIALLLFLITRHLLKSVSSLLKSFTDFWSRYFSWFLSRHISPTLLPLLSLFLIVPGLLRVDDWEQSIALPASNVGKMESCGFVPYWIIERISTCLFSGNDLPVNPLTEMIYKYDKMFGKCMVIFSHGFVLSLLIPDANFWKTSVKMAACPWAISLILCTYTPFSYCSSHWFTQNSCQTSTHWVMRNSQFIAWGFCSRLLPAKNSRFCEWENLKETDNLQENSEASNLVGMVTSPTALEGLTQLLITKYMVRQSWFAYALIDRFCLKKIWLCGNTPRKISWWMKKKKHIQSDVMYSISCFSPVLMNPAYGRESFPDTS